MYNFHQRLTGEQVKILKRAWNSHYPAPRKFARKPNQSTEDLENQNVYAREVLAMEYII